MADKKETTEDKRINLTIGSLKFSMTIRQAVGYVSTIIVAISMITIIIVDYRNVKAGLDGLKADLKEINNQLEQIKEKVDNQSGKLDVLLTRK